MKNIFIVLSHINSQSEIFRNIVDETFNPLNGTEAVYALRAAIYKIRHDPKGPVHINLSNDVLLSEEFQDFDLS